ncbi:nitroreductase family protein [Faecalicatena faecalis]|uniref:nitroreductase family protein n=1 Tax=Faecalicatena faecalis TaxID=2726362 RepID=UPI002ED0A19A
MDIGMAAMGLCYEATSLGLGTCMIGTMNQEKLHQAFGIPKERVVRLIITVGYPAKSGEPRRKIRKDLDEVLGYNHW